MTKSSTMFLRKNHYKVKKYNFVSNSTIKEVIVRKSKNTLMSSSAAILSLISLTHSVEITEIHFHAFLPYLNFVKILFLLKSLILKKKFGESEFLVFSHCGTYNAAKLNYM